MNRLSMFNRWSILCGLLLMIASFATDNSAVTARTHTDNHSASFVGMRWQLASFTLDQSTDMNGDSKPDTDLTQFLRPCDLDNGLVFEPTGKLTEDIGTLDCIHQKATINKPSRGWSYDGETKILRLIGENKSVSEWTVLESLPKSLKVKVVITEEGQPLTATMIWEHL
ncbi:hypothetical protein [Spirosoma oryzicola]|uniref:hypothetical protein n=1 Tax=Spirosoma oryzicola TaxID=2898794 RepID=UPI001E42F178|nr:hypothetical protein [Spirosoma oryzicola]UHG93870.1 hypothetical protein LQ777_24185 [Spirosoma oryzicola]